MYHHGPSLLRRSVTLTRPWWTEDELDPLPDEPPCPASADDSHVPIRWDLVERVRREIGAGTYETPEKWEFALDRLAEKLQLDR
jgi:hypothetical protein